METTTLVDDKDLHTPAHTLENEISEDQYSGLKKLAHSARLLLNEPLLHNNHFDRHIESHGHEAPHWIAWLKAV